MQRTSVTFDRETIESLLVAEERDRPYPHQPNIRYRLHSCAQEPDSGPSNLTHALLGVPTPNAPISWPARSCSGQRIGAPHAGHDMYFTYPQLIAHAARTRKLSAGTVANKDETAGSSCIAEVRANEELANGKASTPFLKFGDRVRIEALDDAGQTIFGAIDHRLARA